MSPKVYSQKDYYLKKKRKKRWLSPRMVIALRSLKSRQPQVQLYGGLISSFALLCGDCQLWRRRCCLRFSSPCLAFLCPQTRLALPFPLLHIGEHLKRFPPLSGHLVCTWLFQVRKTQPSKAFACTVPGPLGAERAASSYLVSFWDDGFHSTPGWGVCGCHWVHESAWTVPEWSRTALLIQESCTCSGWSSWDEGLAFGSQFGFLFLFLSF